MDDQENTSERREEIIQLLDAHETANEDLYFAKLQNDGEEILRLRDQPDEFFKKTVEAMYSFRSKYPCEFKHWPIWDEVVHDTIDEILAVYAQQLLKQRYGGGEVDFEPVRPAWEAYNAAWFRKCPEHDVPPSLRGKYGLGTEFGRNPASTCPASIESSDDTAPKSSSSYESERCVTPDSMYSTLLEDDPEEIGNEVEFEKAKRRLRDAVAILEETQRKQEVEKQDEQVQEVEHEKLMETFGELIWDVQDELMDLDE